MPSRNTRRVDMPEAYYHVYARRANKEELFTDPTDYNYFLQTFVRHLSKEPIRDKAQVLYTKYFEEVELLSYCLMGNHFHLLLYQKKQGGVTKLMRSIMTSYSRYFNLRHRRTGPVFESRYKASHINEQKYLEHISRYIHLNPRYWKRYPYSSVGLFIGSDDEAPDWIHPQKILSMFKSRAEYKKFLEDYEAHKKYLELIKNDLPDQ